MTEMNPDDNISLDDTKKNTSFFHSNFVIIFILLYQSILPSIDILGNNYHRHTLQTLELKKRYSSRKLMLEDILETFKILPTLMIFDMSGIDLIVQSIGTDKVNESTFYFLHTRIMLASVDLLNQNLPYK
jgi:hypothetical protein